MALRLCHITDMRINAMTAQEQIISVLGGAKAVGIKKGKNLPFMHEPVRAGIRFAAVEAFQLRYQISQAQVQYLLDISERTLARRKTEQLLNKSESDRLYRVARIAALAEDVLGSSAAASVWFKEKLPMLGGVTPWSLLDTDEGAQRIADLLGRIEHGVYS